MTSDEGWFSGWRHQTLHGSKSSLSHALSLFNLLFSQLSWWNRAYMLQIFHIYHGMKLIMIITLCLSHLLDYVSSISSNALLERQAEWATMFLPKVLLKDNLIRKNCVYFAACHLNAAYSSLWNIHTELCISYIDYGHTRRPTKHFTVQSYHNHNSSIMSIMSIICP